MGAQKSLFKRPVKLKKRPAPRKPPPKIAPKKAGQTVHVSGYWRKPPSR